MADGDGRFTRIGRGMDKGAAAVDKAAGPVGDGIGKGVDTGLRIAQNSAAQISHALGLDPIESTISSGVAILADTVGAHETAAYQRGIAALLQTDFNRANMSAELGKIIAQTKGATKETPAPEIHPRIQKPPRFFVQDVSTSAPENNPTTPRPLTQREKNIEEQRLLKEAGYGDILTRHSERNGGIDGLIGRDTLAAEAQYRKDHHLAANEAITGGETALGHTTPPPTPAGPGAAVSSKLQKI